MCLKKEAKQSKMNKCKDVSLLIKVSQNLNGRDSDNFELFTTGRLKKRKGKWIVEYENEYNGISKVLLFNESCVNIITNGDISYVLKLDSNKKTKFSCSTKDTFSYFSVETKNIFFEIDEEGFGVIDVEYFLEIDDVGGVLQNRVRIKLK